MGEKIMKLLLGISLQLIFSSFAFATFLPPNDLWKQDRIQGLDSGTTMTEVEFNQIIDKVSAHMEPSVKLHGGTLVVGRRWTDPTVNANSNQFFNQWHVNMYGGLARRPEITADGFTLVMCHEMGHHLGGYPFFGIMGRWAASEGQADYFASEVCARKVWSDDKTENAKSRFSVLPFAKTKCDSQWKNQDEQNLCYRIAMAAQSLGLVLSTVKKTKLPDFSTPDQTEVASTLSSYGSVQCRIDTYFNGALCPAQFDLSVIPGRHVFGAQSGRDVEEEAAKYSCMKTQDSNVGVRPACWFKQSI
jgi:hypothetical protein